jgi:hypothetical protein
MSQFQNFCLCCPSSAKIILTLFARKADSKLPNFAHSFQVVDIFLKQSMNLEDCKKDASSLA